MIFDHAQPRRRPRSLAYRLGTWAAVLGVGLALSACSIKDIVGVTRPSNILDPDQVKTYDGAISLANGAQAVFNISFMGAHALNGSGIGAVGPFAVASGVQGDEFTTWPQDALDGRRSTFDDPGGATTIFSFIGNAHMNAGQAIRYLHAYAKDAPTSYLANMFIVRAFTDIFLSELYCSGVALSDASADGSVSYTSAVSKEDLQHIALQELDSAAAYAPADSTDMLNLIQMGRARAYMNLQQYDDAAQAVANVPTSFSYTIQYSSSQNVSQSWFQSQTYATVADNEGGNGLDYISAHDPRVVVDSVTAINGIPIYIPHNSSASVVHQVLENGIDARLIEAEVELSHQQYSQWLATLNALRTTCTTTASCATPAPAGDGNVAGLPPLTDPGNDHDRLLLTFRERAFWLFGTGHRQGDMRRLIRQYGLAASSVYPTGLWRDGLQFGTEVNSVPDPLELKYNPKYSGCIDREA